MKKTKTKWNVKSRLSDDLQEHLLKLRFADDKDKFLSPSFDQLYNPDLLPNIDLAVKMTQEAIEQDKVIGIFGDYDADGIPASALLYRGLKLTGAKVEVFIPRRELGYGLSVEGIDDLISRGVNLIIAVDNGTTAVDEIAYAKSKNIDVIVLDHHLPHDVLPQATIVNHKLQNSQYPFAELCATGIVFKFLTKLGSVYQKIDERWLKWNMDLVAVATICDMVPLVDENRVLAFLGLKVLNQTKNVGLKALLKLAKIEPGKINAYTIGFIIGPRINALGRMGGDPVKAFWLLASEDAKKVEMLAKEVDQFNQERQQLLTVAMKQADDLASGLVKADTPAVVLAHQEWPVGIAGLIAGRMAEKYCRPAFIFEQTGELYKGSARSLEPISLPPILEAVSTLLNSYGGHHFAAGLTVKPENFSKFSEQIFKEINTKWPEFDYSSILDVDAALELSEISMKLSYFLEKLEPFGFGNDKPKFLFEKVKFSNAKIIGQDQKHLRGQIIQNDHKINFIAFNFGLNLADLQSQAERDVVASIEINRYGGNETPELKLIDYK